MIMLCKKDYLGYLHVGNWYDVVSNSDGRFELERVEGNSRWLLYFVHKGDVQFLPYIYDYFCTGVELRRYKLEKLEEL